MRVLDCPICGGIGSVVDRTVDGKLVVRPCDCGLLENERLAVLRRLANLPLVPSAFKLDERLETYVDSFRSKYFRRRAWLVFAGAPGVGKTTRAAAVADAIIELYRRPVRFYNAFDLTRRMVATKNRRERDDIKEAYLNADFVVLDDFLKVVPSADSFSFSDFYEATLELVWSRYDARLPLAITTQASFKDFIRFDSALAQRVLEMCGGKERVINLRNGKNWRIPNENQNNRVERANLEKDARGDLRRRSAGRAQNAAVATV